MSVAFTEQAVIERRKTVTRRKGWLFVKPGDLIRADEDRQWKHVSCPDAQPEREHPVCQTCWLTHPEAEGVCDR